MPIKPTAPALVAAIDANIVIAATFCDEKFHALAIDLLSELGDAGARFIAPPLWESETSSIVRMRVETKKVTPPEAEASAYAFLDSLPIEVIYAPEIKLRARELALQLRLNRVYDATYLALALDEGAQFWTADERFYNLVAPSFSAVKFLGNWKSGDPFV